MPEAHGAAPARVHGAPVALVTGAGSGIGRSVCQLLSARGWGLVLVGRRAARLAGTGALLSTAWEAVPADIADPAQVHGAVDAALRRFGRLDALINNAGYAPIIPLEQTTPEAIRQVFDVNAVAAAVAIVRAWPIFCAQGGGRIVNVSSYSTVDPFPGLFAYAGAKGAVNLLARAAANEGRSLGITAFAVAPGAVETEMLRSNIVEASLPRSKTLTPEEVARVIVECATGERDAESGQTLLVPSP